MMGRSKALKHIAATLAVLSAAAISGGGPTFSLGEPDLSNERITYSKGHYRNNWAQKQRHHNLEKNSRRRKNKAARKARRKNR